MSAITQIQPKKRTDWNALIVAAGEKHWRKLKVTIEIREKLHAGKPRQLDAAKAMLKARGLEDAIEAVDIGDPLALASAADKVVDEGVCEFHRRQDKPGIWFPANNLKACLKENWSVLGYNMDARPRTKRKEETGKALRGSRGALREGVFVVSCNPEDRDWIYLGKIEDVSGIDMSVSHTTGPSGPQSAIKRNEFLWKPKMSFEIWQSLAIADKLPEESLADVLYHAGEHGIGANRSQGFGRFNIVNVEDI